MKNYRQGDWTFIEITKEEWEKEKASNKMIEHGSSFIFAEGEATNHFHTIVAQRPEDLEIVKTPTGDYVFVLKSAAKATHPEHSMKVDLEIAPTFYRLSQRREKDWLSLQTRKVID